MAIINTETLQLKRIDKVYKKKYHMDTVTAETVTISESAAERIAVLVQKEVGDAHFRVSVSGGGCSGFQYHFSFDNTINEDDLVIKRDQARVAIDAVSLDFLKGSEINFVQELMGSHFEIRNPNAKASCGCGSSFSVF